MQKKSLSYASYWRDSLADSDLGRGGVAKRDLDQHLQRPVSEFLAGRLDAKLTASLFEDEVDDADTVDVVLRPYVYERSLIHGKSSQNGLPDIVTPSSQKR